MGEAVGMLEVFGLATAFCGGGRRMQGRQCMAGEIRQKQTGKCR